MVFVAPKQANFPFSSVPTEVVDQGRKQVSIYQGVATSLMAHLHRRPEEIQLNLKLVDDLTMESFCFMAIPVYFTEVFGLEFKEHELTQSEVVGNPRYTSSGDDEQSSLIDADGLSKIREQAPFIEIGSKFEEKPVINQFLSLLTVNTLCRWVAHKKGVEWKA